MEYVNIGTDFLIREYMNTVMDTDIGVKPVGGLWCTECYHIMELPWMDHMLRRKGDFFRKAPKDNLFKQKGVLVSLKPETKVFELHGEEGKEILSTKYKGSYEAMSDEYDAVFVNIYKIFGRDSMERERNFRLFSVSTMLLFNLDCIESYKGFDIDIDPFDYYDSTEDVDYRTEFNSGKKVIEPASPEYLQLVEDISKKFRNFILMERRNHPNVSTNELVYLLYKQIVEAYKDRIDEICKRRQLIKEKLSYSLSSNAYTLVRKTT